MNVDYEDQTLEEKVFLGMKSSSNPLFTFNQIDQDVVALENGLTALREENRRLNQIQTNLIYSNREKMRIVDELRSMLKEFKIEEEQQAVGRFEDNDEENSFLD